MSVDFPRGWEITRATEAEYHHNKCSFNTAGMICDCNVLMRHPEMLDKCRFYGAGGEVLSESYDGTPASTEGYDALWLWFGLSRSAFCVLPRVMMHDMPDHWQERFAALMREWDEAWVSQPDIGARVQITQHGQLVKAPRWLLDYRHPDRLALASMRLRKGAGE